MFLIRQTVSQHVALKKLEICPSLAVASEKDAHYTNCLESGASSFLIVREISLKKSEKLPFGRNLARRVLQFQKGQGRKSARSCQRRHRLTRHCQSDYSGQLQRCLCQCRHRPNRYKRRLDSEPN